jgi:radical SAM protein with 4Fe4S-binding SPASM domain
VNDEFVFYNSLQHIGARLTELEVQILDLYYKYQDKEYIISQFPSSQQEAISIALDAIDFHKLLSCEEIKPSDETAAIPTVFYLHLTYKCNLACTYCYNKLIRKGYYQTLKLQDWKTIIDKIIAYAETIVLTGGECFLYRDIVSLVKYIKEKKSSVKISCISNGMHHFDKNGLDEIFNYLTSISFSCDSLNREGERIGFDPNLFKTNIISISKKFPHLKVTVASTFKSDNSDDIKQIATFCKDHHCSWDNTMVIPGNVEEIDLMPDLKAQEEINANTSNLVTHHLNPPRLHCGAGRIVCSIDPEGNVYPCQSLHYEVFKMGNILKMDLPKMRYIATNEFCLKTVNELTICSQCKVKYICGGNCLANSYRLYNGEMKRNHLTCNLSYKNAIIYLKSLNNRIYE